MSVQSEQQPSAVRAVLQYLQAGTYPNEAEAGFTISDGDSMAQIASAIDYEIASIKADIEDICSKNARALEAYLAQTTSLVNDIEQLQKQSDDLQYRASQQNNADEGLYKLSDELDSLQYEQSRTSNYISALNQIWFIKATIIELRSCFQSRQYVQTIQLLKSAETKITTFPDWQHISLLSALNEEVSTIDAKVFQGLDALWARFIVIDATASELIVCKHLEGDDSDMSLANLADALTRYDFTGKVKSLTGWVRDTLLVRILNAESPVIVQIAESDEKASLRVTPASSYSIHNLLEYLANFVRFINTMLPEHISHALAVELMSVLSTKLIDDNLQACVPLALTDIPQFEGLLQSVHHFDMFLRKQKWTDSSSSELAQWAKRVPSVWYKKMCDHVLITTRRIVTEAKMSDRKIVEKAGVVVSLDALHEIAERRSEEHNRPLKMTPSADDAKDSEPEDFDWNDNWDDGEDDTLVMKNQPQDDLAAMDNAGEDDDAWGFNESLDLDDSGNNDIIAAKTDDTKAVTSDLEDWNWADDADDDTTDIKSDTRLTNKPKQSSLGLKKAPKHAQVKVTPPPPLKKKLKPLIPKSSLAGSNGKSDGATTENSSLKETYVVTTVPQQILGLIDLLMKDADDLATTYRTSSIAPASPNLRSLVSCVLGAFRALAPLHYGDSFDSHFYLSNDCLYLSEQVSLMKDLGGDAYLLKEMSTRFAAGQEMMMS
ncbi:Centromere/kinetochore Zw10-domain-containing protein [Limtongia smithiae]|uniref:Centromere/kinetochore Zw10-domain-containing protein n=1 Tax=Limtongia smithiae TaxID=1125753 RepID=UPI0034CF700A